MADAYTLELVEPGGADLGELSALSLEGFLHDAGLLGDDGDSAQRAATRWAPLVTLPGGGAADAPTVMDVGLPSPSSVLRCIDAEHPLDCTRCTPAPLDASQVELVGDSGRKNGEKKLRALITRVPEWNLLSERRKLVPLAVAAGMTGLPAALEEKKTSALRKAHLIFLARCWNYKSDTWTARHDRRADAAMSELRRRAAQTGQLVAPAAPLVRFADAASAPWGGQWNEHVLAPEAVWLFTQKTLRPLSLRVAGAFAGDRARVAALTEGDHITHAAAGEVRKVADLAPGLMTQLAGLHALLTAAQRALPHELARTTARTCLASPVYASADALLRMALDAGIAQLNVAARASSARLTRGDLTSAERCWLDEMASSHDATLELLSHVARVLHAFRDAPMDDFLTVAGSMLELLMVFVTSLGGAAAAREAWMREMLRARAGAGAQERAQLLVCWPAAPGELGDSGSEPNGGDSSSGDGSSSRGSMHAQLPGIRAGA